MPTVNKASLREEFDTLKDEFKRLSSDGKMTAGSLALVNALLMLFDLVLAVFMEKATSKDSTNSSKPSSQTQADETATTHTGSKRKGRAQNGAVSTHTRTVETVQVVAVSACDRCGEDLSGTTCQRHERRTLIDLVFEKVVIHVDAEIKVCADCGAQTKGRFPAGMRGPVQYGAGVKAYILNLLVAQMVPLNRLQKLVQTLIGVVMSEATMLKYVMQLYWALERWEQTAIQQLLAMPALHADETSMRVDKKNHWIHVVSAGEITLKCLHRKRGCAAIEDIGIIPRYGGVVIHDCWASYLSYDHCGHGLCGSHLLRELTFVVDSNQYAWAANMKRLLQETCARVSNRKRKKLTQKEYSSLQKRYRTILTQGEKELPPVPVRRRENEGELPSRMPTTCANACGSMNRRSFSLPGNRRWHSPTTGPSVTCE